MGCWRWAASRPGRAGPRPVLRPAARHGRYGERRGASLGGRRRGRPRPGLRPPFCAAGCGDRLRAARAGGAGRRAHALDRFRYGKQWLAALPDRHPAGAWPCVFPQSGNRPRRFRPRRDPAPPRPLVMPTVIVRNPKWLPPPAINPAGAERLDAGRSKIAIVRYCNNRSDSASREGPGRSAVIGLEFGFGGGRARMTSFERGLQAVGRVVQSPDYNSNKLGKYTPDRPHCSGMGAKSVPFAACDTQWPGTLAAP